MKCKKLNLAGLLAAALFLAAGAKAETEDLTPREQDARGELSGSINKGIYSKPFWRRMGKGTFIGGYVDFDYTKAQGSNGRFDQHRLIPFIYADIAEGLRFATEIEFEHGGPQSNQRDGEMKVEFAVLDYEIFAEKLAMRGGIILSPLGKFNLVHDTPLLDIKVRPLVDTNILPTTLSEAGYGVFGTFYPTELQKVDYELYLVNGFNGTRVDTTMTAPAGGGAVTAATSRVQGGNITSAAGVRGARGSARADNNNNKAFVGRIGYSPRLGYELGLSGHHGAYDDEAQNDLTIGALDAAAQFGPLELLGEAAVADIDRGAGISKTSVPGRLDGWWTQANFHFFQEMVRPGSTFTASARFERYDTDLSSRRSRIVYGLNFRPVEDAVFVVDYEMNQEAPKTRNNAVTFSFASYF